MTTILRKNAMSLDPIEFTNLKLCFGPKSVCAQLNAITPGNTVIQASSMLTHGCQFSFHPVMSNKHRLFHHGQEGYGLSPGRPEFFQSLSRVLLPNRSR